MKMKVIDGSVIVGDEVWYVTYNPFNDQYESVHAKISGINVDSNNKVRLVIMHYDRGSEPRVSHSNVTYRFLERRCFKKLENAEAEIVMKTLIDEE